MSPLSLLINPNENSFFVSPCTADEVTDVITSLKMGKTSGPNSIPMKLLKILLLKISANLSTLINYSFESGIFPNNLKIAEVIPIFKNGLTTRTSNYKPISLLSIFSKITEKIMHRRLYRILEWSDILFNLQFGFRREHSPEHALVSLTENIKSSWENLAVEYLLQKALDTVNHNILFKDIKL